MKASPEQIEAACIAVYGKSWSGPPEKQPGEAMKRVWRDFAERFINAALAVEEEKERHASS